MDINNYIFLTIEGYTFQPNSESILPDINNLQVIGFSSGIDAKDAFRNLLEIHPDLKETNFDEVFCYKLDKNYKASKKYFYISDYK